MAAATEDVRDSFQTLNAEYEQRFGHVFLICATGQTAEAMLTSLKSRLKSSPDTELHTAAAEQCKIMLIRLNRLLSERPASI